MMRFGFLLMSLMYGLIFVFADEFVDKLVGPQSGDAVLPLQILLVGLLANIPGSFKSGLLQGAGHQGAIARLGIILATICLTLVAILGSIWGAAGAAVAVTSVYIIQYFATTIMFANLGRGIRT